MEDVLIRIYFENVAALSNLCVHVRNFIFQISVH